MTDVGRTRSSNEDQFVIAVLAKVLQIQQSSLGQPRVQYSKARGYLFAVADGMGGHAGGQRASALTVDFIESFLLDMLRHFVARDDKEQGELLAEFREAIGQADARVWTEAHRHPELSGMGTTVTLAYSFDDELYVVHVGDSRCYLMRGGELRQVTSDHTMAQEMVRLGYIQAAAALDNQWRHVITNVVGGSEPGVQVEAHHLRLESGDCLLLCSDGLTEMLSDDAITAVLETEPDPKRACECLVAQANERGGRDNITVIVGRYEEQVL
jgi:protein phosphatase